MTPGLSSLLHNAGIVDVSDRGRIRVTGEDRARLLHAMTTNHIQQMKPRDMVYAFFLNAQGRIQADVWILCYDDHFLLDTEPATRQGIYEHLDRYIIADDVTLEDITEDTYELIARGARIHGPVQQKDEMIAKLEGEGAIMASTEDAEAARIMRFIPKYGADINDHTLPQESQLMQAIHFQKGCYLGQEIVERVRSRGHVNKLLTGFSYQAGTAPELSAEITSAVAIEGTVYGLGWAKATETSMLIDGHLAELFKPVKPY
jgi:folate-binding protein YgfZ